MSHDALDPQTLAETVATAMWSRDHAAHALDMCLDSIAPGSARLSMTVRPDMLNGHAMCHGGMLFTLADTAFAYACNSGNHNTVASAANIDFLAPSHQGDRLQAHAQVRTQGGRTGVYDITVHNLTSGRDVALFRGKSHRIQGLVTESLVAEAS
ncbi:hydroxyphenylacetyl-CoA thioesterase PaaI [Castellaniella sp.]|uniref:hydroxyphenylacetyl-CoA thioesterase PaaI n=1 Tax=Castellaniella sp. TaxID=1955812 RepID=UPI003C723432